MIYITVEVVWCLVWSGLGWSCIWGLVAYSCSWIHQNITKTTAFLAYLYLIIRWWVNLFGQKR